MLGEHTAITRNVFSPIKTPFARWLRKNQILKNIVKIVCKHYRHVDLFAFPNLIDEIKRL